MNENRQTSRNTENKPRRVPVSGDRDILTVLGKDPNKSYRFVLDKDENGARIQRFIRGGWEFTDASVGSGIQVGEENVYKSRRKELGSIVRMPAGDGQHLYLMEIRKEWFDEDQAAKQAKIDEQEAAITGKRSSADNELGQYGNVKIDRK